jgi:hypothetical protein
VIALGLAAFMWVSLLAGCAQPAADPRARAETPSQKDRPDAVTLLLTSPYKEAERLWPVPKDTKLSRLKKTLEAEAPSVLPRGDREDKSSLPLWFRVYFRKIQAHADPPLPTSGPYQYPRTANRLLQHLIDNPNADDIAVPSGVTAS